MNVLTQLLKHWLVGPHGIDKRGRVFGINFYQNRIRCTPVSGVLRWVQPSFISYQWGKLIFFVTFLQFQLQSCAAYHDDALAICQRLERATKALVKGRCGVINEEMDGYQACQLWTAVLDFCDRYSLPKTLVGESERNAHYAVFWCL
jgi:hypothetical protein